MEFMDVLCELRNTAYDASANLEARKGHFRSGTTTNMDKVSSFNGCRRKYRIRLKSQVFETHLTSIAPTGTISLTADNVSVIGAAVCSFLRQDNNRFRWPRIERVEDFAYSLGIKGRTANEISVDDHLRVPIMAFHNIDSAVPKTCNVGDHVTYGEFKDVYYKA